MKFFILSSILNLKFFSTFQILFFLLMSINNNKIMRYFNKELLLFK